MLLGELVKGVPRIRVQGPRDVGVTEIVYDSRTVRKGHLFVCLAGTRTDGHRYVREALERGAAALVVSPGNGPLDGITLVEARDPRRVLSSLAARYYRHPSRELRLIGVTGTNGKTTTTHLIDRLLAASTPKETGLLGTIGYFLGPERRGVEATTPEALSVHRILREMADRGMAYCTMEVSSHALALHRVDQCDFNVAVLTNVTEDHLDFHGKFSSYLAAKARIFRGLPRRIGNYAVINGDDRLASYFMKIAPGETISYGIKGEAHTRAVDIDVRPEGVRFRAITRQGSLDIRLKITGLFSVYNALAAITVALREGVSPVLVEKVLGEVKGIPGRLEKVEMGQDFTVLVDYAHTPDGLENVLSTVRQFCSGNLITVFGCGGDRDRSKRPLMGAIALKYSQFAIITNDNPRREPVKQIFDDIMKGIDKGLNKGRFAVIPDREEAIQTAVSRAGSGDIVLVAGKGHETYQVFAHRTIDFDDREVARRYLRERLGILDGKKEV